MVVAAMPPGFNDPATRMFLTDKMSIGRAAHTATLLRDGSVLIAGGVGPRPPLVGLPAIEPSVLASAESTPRLLRLRAPALFSLSGDGRGQGAIWHAITGEIASPPARLLLERPCQCTPLR